MLQMTEKASGGDVGRVAAVDFGELFRLDEHPPGTAARVADAAGVGLDVEIISHGRLGFAWVAASSFACLWRLGIGVYLAPWQLCRRLHHCGDAFRPQGCLSERDLSINNPRRISRACRRFAGFRPQRRRAGPSR